jgi:uncharacterized damage-inducible protein DinB
MPHDERTFIVDQLRRMHTGHAWHGPSVREALEGVDAELARRKVLPSAHTIHALAHHVAAWVDEVRQRLEGRDPGMPEAGDFPAPAPDLDDVQWQGALARLDTAHARLAEAILMLDPARLDDPVGTEPSPPLGTAPSVRAMLHGLVQHDAYHAGQILLLRRAAAS